MSISLDALLDHAPCGFISFTDDGTIRLVNSTLGALLGCTATELTGRRFETLLPAAGRLFYTTQLLPLLQISGRLDEVYLSLLGSNGGAVPVLLNALRRERDGTVLNDCSVVPMRQRDGYEAALLEARDDAQHSSERLAEALGRLEAAHDELKKTQAQLVQAEKMRVLGQLIAGVAHEINNPTAFVASNIAYLAELLPGLQELFAAYAPLRETAGAEQKTRIAAVEQKLDVDYLWRDLPALVAESQAGLQRIRDIVLTLRNLARPDSGAMVEADINEGLRGTVQIVRPLCQGRVELVEQYGEVPAVKCRPGSLNQVFLNLLMNALQAIPTQGRIIIRSAFDGERVRVAISDNGAGMDPATLARLGEPFFTTKPPGQGTGLGLAISFGIVEAHGGRLFLSSTPGEGTTATVELLPGDA